jgi:hypothetical protein
MNTDEAEVQKQAVNGVFCANTLTTHFRNAIWEKKKGPELLTNQWCLLQDNAQPHSVHLTTETASRHQWNTCRMPYRPDLTACDFFLEFPVVKHEPQGQKLSTDTEVKKKKSLLL